MKKLFVILGLLAVVVLAVPVVNFLSSSHEKYLNLEQIKHEKFKAAADILIENCADCHSSKQQLPFYAKLPIAKDLIADDIRQGMARFSFDEKLKENGAHFSELDLARLEAVTYNDSMSPMRYRLLHWDRGFNNDEKIIVRNWIYDERARRRKDMGITGELAGEPFAPLPSKVELSQEKVLLGNKLFHDTRLSGDGTMSCASCHSLKKGGTDQAVSSTGIRGQIGPINAPTVFNAVYNHRQFWDGRAKNLEEQAAGPVSNPKEMGADWDDVLMRLKQDQNLVAQFDALYNDGFNKQNLLNAIATFESSLITPNSKFDRYLRGEQQAMNHQELRGYELFKVNCVSCHAGPNMGGLSFEKLGAKKDYFLTRARKPNDADLGLYNFSKKEEDKHFFKVPTLRNIAITHPYFHDGSAKSLEEAIDIMITHQGGKKFNQVEVAEVASFLRTLTGEYNGAMLE